MFAALLKPLIRRRLDAFERDYDYDMGYGRQILATSPDAMLRLARLMSFAEYREDAPLGAWFAARLAGAMGEDCGPCTQLLVRMAERSGVAASDLRAILRREPQQMSAEAALGFRFAEAALAHDPGADALRQEVVRRWGDKALLSLCYALSAARLIPTLKYALGHGQACLRVRVGSEDLQVQGPAAA